MKKNIWIWNHYATDMYRNRGGRHYWFAENLIKQSYMATVFCASTYHNTSSETISTKNKKSISAYSGEIPFVFVKTVAYAGNGVQRILNMLMFYKNLFPVAKEYAKKNGKPDVILASSVHPLTLVAGIKIAKKFGVPCICEVRDLWPEALFFAGKLSQGSLFGKMLLKGEHWIYKKADALIFTKEGDIDYIKEQHWDVENPGAIPLNKCHYINNGVDLAAFKRSLQENIYFDPDLDESKFNIVYAGAIRPVNDVGRILDAAAFLREEENIRFLIYGTGNQYEFLKRRVADENLNNVKMKGYVNKQFIPSILSKAGLNILNYSQSQYNWARGNSSNKLFEYMASGKPIVSTVKMGYCLLGKYDCGVSVGHSGGEGLAKSILQIKNLSPEEYEKMGDNAKKAAADFDFKILTSKLIAVVESVI